LILGETYYGGRHFVWCSPYFEYSSQAALLAPAPPTSTPKEIYQNLAMEVERGDRHSAKIKESRSGLLKGAKYRLDDGVISLVQFEEIRYIINVASITDFQPLLYVINYGSVSANLIVVPVNKRASPVCIEYQLTQLERKDFEALELPRMKV
jgi:hypothetical protein